MGELGERLMRIEGLGDLGNPVEYRGVHNRSDYPYPPTGAWMDHGDPRLVSPNGVIDYNMPGIPWRDQYPPLAGIGEEPPTKGIIGGMVVAAGLAFVAGVLVGRATSKR
jgi:hypothetical protein